MWEKLNIFSCWKIIKILNLFIIYCVYNFLENVCIYFYIFVDWCVKFFGKVFFLCFFFLLIVVELDCKCRFNKFMDLEVLVYIYVCLLVILKKWFVDFVEILKNDKFNWLFYLILLVKWVVISIVIFRWFVYNDLFIIKYNYDK